MERVRAEAALAAVGAAREPVNECEIRGRPEADSEVDDMLEVEWEDEDPEVRAIMAPERVEPRGLGPRGALNPAALRHPYRSGALSRVERYRQREMRAGGGATGAIAFMDELWLDLAESASRYKRVTPPLGREGGGEVGCTAPGALASA